VKAIVTIVALLLEAGALAQRSSGQQDIIGITKVIQLQKRWGESRSLFPATNNNPIIRREPNVPVTKQDAASQFFETFIAADPSNSKRLLGCSMYSDVRRSGSSQIWSGTIAFASSDSGKSWTSTLRVENVSKAWDPSCTFGMDGKAYFLTDVSEGDLKSEDRMWLFRSTDGGKTWDAPTILAHLERPFVTVESSNQQRDHVYIIGTDLISRPQCLTNYHSTDDGITFPPPVNVDGDASEITPTQNVLLSDGTYVVAYAAIEPDDQTFPPSRPNGSLKVVSSSDGGATFSSPVPVRQVVWAAGSVPSLAVDQSDSPFHDRLYLVWTDYRTRRGEILLAYSDDKGKGWSRPVVVSDDRQRADPADGPHNTMPTVAVNRNGAVGVMWYDRREHTDNVGYWVRFTASVDGGESFSPSTRISDAPASFDRSRLTVEGFARSSIVSLRPNRFFGHTAGLAAGADGVFHPFWVDNRSGNFQIWTARLTVQGKAVRNGSPELAELDDLTEKVRVEAFEARVDWRRRTATIGVSITNRSGEVITAPLKIRAISLRTMLGAYTVAAANADNAAHYGGAIWDFSGMLDSGKLRPGQTSKVRKLTWRWTNISPKEFERLLRNNSMLDQEIKVLGRLEK